MNRFARAWTLGLLAVLALALAAPAHAQSRNTQKQVQQPRVYLLRGLANIFSLGMDDLAAKLNARGIKASVHSYVDWQALTNIAVNDASAGKRRPTSVIIIGHSLGADAAVYMANKVSATGVPVPLVVTFDPVTPTIASAKIGKVVNYYQAGGSGKAVSGPRVQNIDLTSSGALSHFNIDKAGELHARVIAMIERPARPVVRRPRPVAVQQPAAPVTPAATPTATTTPVPAASTETAAAPIEATPAAVRAPN